MARFRVDKPIIVYLIITGFFLAVFALVLYSTIFKEQQKVANLHYVNPADPLLPQAKERARYTLDTLFVLFPQYRDKCYVKYPIIADGLDEHRWDQLRELDSDHVSLIQAVPGSDEATGKELQLPLELVEDWLVEMPDGTIRGGFTTQLILKREAEKGNADAAKQLEQFTDRL